MSTYIKAIPQCCAQLVAAVLKRDNPMRLIVGAMHRGPMKGRRNPKIPLNPSKISKIDANAIEP